MNNPQWFQWLSLMVFILAILHTFSTKYFERLAHRYPNHSGIFHLLGEVEAVFGFWSALLIIVMLASQGKNPTIDYLESRSYIEPLFVFVIMVVAATRPILRFSMLLVQYLAKALPINPNLAFYFVTLGLVPLFGSLITEPAAMTVAALILRDRFYSQSPSNHLKYFTLAVLFVNVSVGGALTAFAAPPILMVAKTWMWDNLTVFLLFGEKAILICLINALGVAYFFRQEISALTPIEVHRDEERLPSSVLAIHLVFLVLIVIFAHHPSLFLGFFLFFLGYAQAYKQYQDRLLIREGLMVAFFLAGLVVIGGLQQWWLSPLLKGMSPQTVYYGATVLTAFTDNAAITYLGSLITGAGDAFKYAIVAGAITGGGMTVIANAPNPAGFAILQNSFSDRRINPLALFKAAILPTLLAILVFRWVFPIPE